MAKEYQHYTFEDFITDDDFIDWVKYPSDASTAFWEVYIAENPHQTHLIDDAKEAVQQLAVASRKHAPEKDRFLIWNKLKTNKVVEKNTKVTWMIGWKAWVAAASVLVIMGATLGVRLWFNGGKSESVYTQQLSAKKDLLKEISNTTREDLSVVLPDNSIITLKPDSRFSYDSLFGGNLREVFLSGEAFFDVQRNPRKPFIVYANGLVTKVLGTSFSVKAFENNEHVTVQVKTGKVAVYSTKTTDKKDPETGGFILLPNQRIEFGTADERFVRTLVEEPTMLKPNSDLSQFAFVDTPAHAIFETLENAYGVELLYDRELLSDCYLTTTLTNESLFEKLDIICTAMDASYKEIDAQIIIYSKGCK